MCGSFSSASTPRSAPPSVSPAPAPRGGLRTSAKIASHDSTDIAPSTTKAVRHEVASISHASGVPVSSMPIVPSAIAVPDTAAKRCAGKRREMNTVQATKAGEQPIPISAWPSSSSRKSGAAAASAAPIIVSGNAVSTVRRSPRRSMPIPIASCSVPNAKWKVPAKSPSACSDSANSCCSGGAMIAAVVRYAWLSAKAETSATSIVHGLRSRAVAAGADPGCASGGGFIVSSSAAWGASCECYAAVSLTDRRTVPGPVC